MDLSVDVVGIGNREQAISHLALVGSLQEKLIVLQGGQADGPFVTAENIANGAQKLTETLGYKTPGLFFQPADKVMEAVSVPMQPLSHPLPPSPDLVAAQAQIEIMREAVAADLQIKRSISAHCRALNSAMAMSASYSSTRLDKAALTSVATRARL